MDWDEIKEVFRLRDEGIADPAKAIQIVLNQRG